MMLKRNVFALGLCTLFFVACSKQEPIQQPESSLTSDTTPKMSQECEDYMQVLRTLATEDAKLKEALDKNLDKVTEEWATLSADQQADYTKQCVLMTDQFAKLQQPIQQDKQ